MRTAAGSKALLAALLLIIAALLSGCIVAPQPQPYTPQQIAPVPRSLSFEKNLICLGKLLEAYSDDTRPIIIGIVSAYDHTGASDMTVAEVPRQFVPMLETAIATISPRIRLAHLDHSWLYGERVLGGNFVRALPKFVIKAAISEFDRGVRQETRRKDGSLSFGNGKGAADIGGNLGRDYAESNIVVDLSAISYSDQATIGGAVATVEVKARRTAQEQAWSIAVGGFGIGDSATVRYVEGRHASLRAAAEAAAMKVVGHGLNLPYWRCGGIWSNPDAAMQTRLMSAFRAAPVPQQFDALLAAVRGHDRQVKPEIESVTTAARRITAGYVPAGDPCSVMSMGWSLLWWNVYATVPTSVAESIPARNPVSIDRCASTPKANPAQTTRPAPATEPAQQRAPSAPASSTPAKRNPPG